MAHTSATIVAIFLLVVGVCIFVFMLSGASDATGSKPIEKMTPLGLDLMDANFDNFPEVTVIKGPTIFKGFLLDNTKNESPKDKVIGPAVYTKGAALVFLNIPYASAPDGKKLNSSHWFSDVKPLNDDTASSFINDRKHRKFGTFCAQGESRHTPIYAAYGMKMGDMDCLTLNIFAPADESARNLPVLVIVHGGSLNKGSAADFGVRGLVSGFVSRGVVVVTMNYRLGALGFLTYPDESRAVKSVRGLTDVMAGLTFVQRYIELFGGDPKRVTLSGFSAGGCLAEVLAINAQTSKEPEFHTFTRIVSHSGPYHVCNRLGGLFSLPIDEMFFAAMCPNVTDSAGRVICLQSAKLEHIAMVGQAFPFGFFLNYPDYQEKIRDPTTLNVSSSGYEVEYLLGITQNEATFFEGAIRKMLAQAKVKNVPEPGPEFLKVTFKALAAKLAAYDPTIPKKIEMVNKLAESYFTGKHGNNKVAVFQFFTDIVFKSALMETVRQLSAMRSKLQVFMFAHPPPFSSFYSDGLSAHESDLSYAYMPDHVWTVLPANREADIRAEAAVADKMQDMLVKFITTGKASDQLKNDPVVKGDVPYLKFDAMTVENSVMPDELERTLSAFRAAIVAPPNA